MKKYVNNTSNNNLLKSKKVKNDEFYTQLPDIIRELKHYKDKFRDKIVYLPCDNPEFSQFYYYFFNKFKTLGLKKLICSFYSPKSLLGNECTNSYVTIVDKDKQISKIKLKGDGDFRSKELIPYWKEADIIVTNPPFSLFREFIDTITFYRKKFLVLGSLSAIFKNNVFRLFVKNKIFLGRSKLKNGELNFLSSDNNELKRVPVRWFTNIERYYPSFLNLKMDYSKQNNPNYDNSDVLFIDVVKNIPKDFFGKMAVGATFIDKYNPDQFKIIGKKSLFLNGKETFVRLIIQRV